MADLDSVEVYLEGKDPDGVALFRRFEALVERCGASERAPRSSIVYWKRRRVFAGAYIERRRLELNIDLLREAEHPCVIAAFHTTKRVITHRLRITDATQLDDSIAALVAEAYADVGPGPRSG
ncbi:MAG: hypothetical protein H0U82_12610 [Actinobacteria bacterium]|nr:hypothetical protein [Actinomycetota bacterium]